MTLFRSLLLITILAGIILIGYIYRDLSGRGVFDRQPPILIRSDTTHLPEITLNLRPGHHEIEYRDVPAQIDSAQIASAYFASVHYNDSIITDTVSIWLKETVSRNAIQSRELTYRLNIPIQTISEYRQELTRGFVFGGGGALHNDRFDVYLSGGVQGKRGSVLFGQIGTDGSVRVGWMGRVSR